MSNDHSQKDRKLVFKTIYRLMQVKRIEECSRGAFCNTSTFIKLPFVIKIFVLSIFEWPFKTGFTVMLKFDQFVAYEVFNFYAV